MEKHEIDAIKKLINAGDYELKKLYEEHVDLDKRVEVLSNKSYLSPEEQSEFASIKKRKLQGKEKILKIVKESKLL